MLHIVLHLFHMLFRAASTGESSGMNDLQRRLHRERQVAHADVPGGPQLRAMLGERIDELHALLMRYDPAEIHTRRSRDRKDPQHINQVALRYWPLASTLTYRMQNDPTYEQLKKVVRLELRLWFGDRLFHVTMRDRPEDLMPTLYRWRQSWDHR